MAPLFTKLKHSQNKSSTFHRCVFLPGKQCILQNVLQDVDCVMCWEKVPQIWFGAKKVLRKNTTAKEATSRPKNSEEISAVENCHKRMGSSWTQQQLFERPISPR